VIKTKDEYHGTYEEQPEKGLLLWFAISNFKYLYWTSAITFNLDFKFVECAA
jgi:hypothetical protein